MKSLVDRLFALDPAVRYVATHIDGKLELNERGGIQNASSSESDKYEELIVNPTLLTLLTQRGNIDCGGLDYVLIRYGSFFQLLNKVPGGHVSVALEPDSDLALVGRVRALVAGAKEFA